MVDTTKKPSLILIVLTLILMCISGCAATKTTEEQAASVSSSTDSKTENSTVANTTETQYVTDFTAGMLGAEKSTATDAGSGEISITITATGDCALAPTQLSGYEESIHNYYDDYGKDYFMKNFKEMFESDDFTLANMECALTDLPYYPEEQPDKAFFLVGKPEYAYILSDSGVDGCSLGNNHSMDVGIEGLQDTEKAIDDTGMLWAVDDVTATYTTKQGIRIGFVSAQLFGAYEDEEYIRNGIKKLKEEGVDLIFACCHWGIEKDYYPTDYQVNLAREFVDLGADLIIGNHPHVVQSIEYYHGKVILYSLGNFCFGANKTPFDMKDMIYQQTFTFRDGKLQDNIDATIFPVQISTDPYYNDYQPILLTGSEKTDMIARINEYCAPYNTVQLDSEGKLLVDPDGELAEPEPAADDWDAEEEGGEEQPYEETESENEDTEYEEESGASYEVEETWQDFP